jgi:hypothetical protein
MHRPGKKSARVVGLQRRLKKERAETLPAKKALLQTTIESVKILPQKDEEVPELEDVLTGKVKARLMMGGKFASKATVQNALDVHQQSIQESLDTIAEVSGKLRRFR